MGAITQLLGGVTQVWPNVTFIICIFVILLFKPERIVKSSLFWLGCVLFALSLGCPNTQFVPPGTRNDQQCPADNAAYQAGLLDHEVEPACLDRPLRPGVSRNRLVAHAARRATIVCSF